MHSRNNANVASKVSGRWKRRARGNTGIHTCENFEWVYRACHEWLQEWVPAETWAWGTRMYHHQCIWWATVHASGSDHYWLGCQLGGYVLVIMSTGWVLVMWWQSGRMVGCDMWCFVIWPARQWFNLHSNVWLSTHSLGYLEVWKIQLPDVLVASHSSIHLATGTAILDH